MLTINELKDKGFGNLSRQEQADIVLDWIENGDHTQTEHIEFFHKNIVNEKKIPVYCSRCSWVGIEVPPSICPSCSGITKELKQ